MGLARKTESRIDRAFQRLFRRNTHVHVKPMELAWKLVKEMEEHRAKVGSRVYVPNRYDVYLCPGDADYYRGQQDVLLEQLRSHLLNHSHQEGFSLATAPEISFHVDEDLKTGQFGIAVEEVDLRGGASLPPQADEGGDRAALRLQSEPAATRVSLPAPSVVAAPAAHSPQTVPRPVTLGSPPVVLRYEGRSERFEQAKIIVGRGKQSDARLSDPNVSRRHAVIFWDRGRLYIEDLGSTNGTLLNGHAVEHSMLRSGDVVTAGDTPISVETG